VSGRFTETETPIAGVVQVTRAPRGDARGWLERVFCPTELSAWSGRQILQVNRTRTARRGTLRGLHVQRAPAAEAKYVSCLHGAVFDVALDLRPGSPSYGRWFGTVLSAEAHDGLILPEGVAHGFQALSDAVEMLYFHSAAHTPEAGTGVDALDPALAIDWPLPPGMRSECDRALPALAAFDPAGLPGVTEEAAP
jgi:dTDP-4-dehydrorhamnose 3,5-epimerase